MENDFDQHFARGDDDDDDDDKNDDDAEDGDEDDEEDGALSAEDDDVSALEVGAGEAGKSAGNIEFNDRNAADDEVWGRGEAGEAGEAGEKRTQLV